MENTNSPLILVFYLDRELMSNKDIMIPFSDHINRTIHEKDANIIAFFLPTDGEERITCINPIQVAPADMEKINKIVEDLTKNFDIGQGADKGKNDDDAHRLIARDDE